MSYNFTYHPKACQCSFNNTCYALTEVFCIERADYGIITVKKDVNYFKLLLKNTTDQLESLASHWDEVNAGLTDASEEGQYVRSSQSGFVNFMFKGG